MFGGKHTLELFNVVRDEAGVVRKATPAVSHTYQFSELTFQAQETLDNWVRKRHMKAVELASEGLSEASKTVAIQTASTLIATLSWNSEYGRRLITCIDGIAMLALVCIQQNHPDQSYESLKERIALPENFEEVMRVVKLASDSKAFHFARAQALNARAKEKARKAKKQKRAAKQLGQKRKRQN